MDRTQSAESAQMPEVERFCIHCGSKLEFFEDYICTNCAEKFETGE